MRMYEFMDKMLEAFPNATVDEDNDGQLIIYTNLTMITSDENPSIPAGEELIIDMDE